LDIPEKLPPHQKLLRGVYFADELPKTTSGKILRRIAREMIYEKIQDRSKDKKRACDRFNNNIINTA
jgi:acyl-coenzyme A synthetase/AMP-(fatty) acid ligase